MMLVFAKAHVRATAIKIFLVILVLSALMGLGSNKIMESNLSNMILIGSRFPHWAGLVGCLQVSWALEQMLNP